METLFLMTPWGTSPCMSPPARDKLQAGAGTEMSAVLGLELRWRCSPGWGWGWRCPLGWG